LGSHGLVYLVVPAAAAFWMIYELLFVYCWLALLFMSLSSWFTHLSAAGGLGGWFVVVVSSCLDTYFEGSRGW
jgi:hypothetical protein